MSPVSEIAELSERLSRLMADPQPGLWSWIQAVVSVIDDLYSVVHEERSGKGGQ